MEYLIINSEIDESSKIYQGARIQNSLVGKNTIVGNFTRIDYSELSAFCRIDRNSHLYFTKMGKHSYSGMNLVSMHSTIGKFCSIAWNVSIGGANHDYTRMTQHSFLYNPHDKIRPDNMEIAYDRFDKPVTIGNDVWIAAGAVITRGVTIGDGAVVGANTVVTTDIPPYSIVVGNPGKVIKYRFSEEIIALMLQLKWWDWEIDKIKQNYKFISQRPTKEILIKILKEENNDTI